MIVVNHTFGANFLGSKFGRCYILRFLQLWLDLFDWPEIAINGPRTTQNRSFLVQNWQYFAISPRIHDPELFSGKSRKNSKNFEISLRSISNDFLLFPTNLDVILWIHFIFEIPKTKKHIFEKFEKNTKLSHFFCPFLSDPGIPGPIYGSGCL